MIHHLAPKPLEDNLLYRSVVLQMCDTPGRQRAVIERCQSDIVWWIDTFAWQFNPKSTGEFTPRTGPFITWPFQEEILLRVRRCIKDGVDVAIEKSRDMGISWVCLLVVGHSYLFEEWRKYLVISRNEKAVDNPGDPDCLFWKLDYCFERVPDWMARCDRNDARRKMGFWHPFTNSSITGQASTGKAGVGGRADAMFIDEFSQIEEDYEVYHRTSDTSSCRIFNGTHVPGGLCFAEITDAETIGGSFIRKQGGYVQCHWTEHPDKRKGLYRYDPISNLPVVLDKGFEYPKDFEFQLTELPTGGPQPGIRSPWYDEQVRRKGSMRAVAMDLDIDRQGGSEKFFDPILLRNLILGGGKSVGCCDPLWKGELLYDPDSGMPRELRQTPDGPLWLWRLPTRSGIILPSDYGMGCDISHGRGTTNSACSIGDSKTGEKVAELVVCDKAADAFAMIVHSLGFLFRSSLGEPALLNWESNGGAGGVFGATVMTLGYPRILMRDLLTVKSGQMGQQAGWFSNPTTKKTLLESYLIALKNRDFTNRSELALRECEWYRWAKDKDTVEHPADREADDPSKARSNHGDRVIADALCWMAMQRLGAGKPESQKPVEEAEPSVYTFEGRRAMRKQQQKLAEAWA